MLLCALGGTPATLLNTMESQLEAVQHRIRKAEDEIVEIKQELTIAKQAGNKGGEEEVKFLRGRLEKLDSRLLSLQEEKNTLLRSQAPSKPCFSACMYWLTCIHIMLHFIHSGMTVYFGCCFHT